MGSQGQIWGSLSFQVPKKVDENIVVKICSFIYFFCNCSGFFFFVIICLRTRLLLLLVGLVFYCVLLDDSGPLATTMCRLKFSTVEFVIGIFVWSRISLAQLSILFYLGK
jgi:hypothetical protein